MKGLCNKTILFIIAIFSVVLIEGAMVISQSQDKAGEAMVKDRIAKLLQEKPNTIEVDADGLRRIIKRYDEEIERLDSVAGWYDDLAWLSLCEENYGGYQGYLRQRYGVILLQALLIFERDYYQQKLDELLKRIAVGGGDGGSCFAQDTLVLMADNSTKPIIDVKKGDLVQAYNESIGKVEARKVTLAENGFHYYYYLINGKLRATPPHPFYTVDRGWIGLAELKVGDRIKSVNGVTEITSFEKVEKKLKIYNITVEGLENFFVSATGKGFFLVK